MKTKFKLNKDILFIAPIFHDYQIMIKQKLELYQAKVDFYPERKYNFLYSLYNNFSKRRLATYQKKHYRSIFKKIKKKKYDILFIVRGNYITEEFISGFKKLNPDSKCIMYQWDSNSANTYVHLINLFDKVYSFDYADVDKYNEIIYLPLFFSDDIAKLRHSNEKPIYNFLFLSVYLQARFNMAMALKTRLESYKISGFIYIYIPITTFIKEFIRNKLYPSSILNIKKLSRQKYLNLLSASSVVIDANNSIQSGLSMRIIEAIGAGKRIITTNGNIINEKFYSEEQIKVIGNEWDTEDLLSFLKSPSDIELSNSEEYSIDNWLLKIFYEN